MSQTIIAPAQQIVDANGVLITLRSIVGMSGDGPWSLYHGLVVEPNSSIERDGYRVGVYFDSEVPSSNFGSRAVNMVMGIDQWDQAYGRVERNGRTDFLFEQDIITYDLTWKRSPRVRFFRPDELVVEVRWSTEALARRLFGNGWHTIYEIPKNFPQNPNAYLCHLKDCPNTATEIGLFNLHGSVFTLFVCKDCLPKVNGICGDDLRPIKTPFRAADGSVIVPTAEAKPQ